MALVQVLGFLNPSVAKLLSNVTLNHPSTTISNHVRFFFFHYELLLCRTIFLADKPRIHFPSAPSSSLILRAPIFSAHN